DLAWEITERKKFEDEIRKFKFISDQSNDAHFLIDKYAGFKYVNKTACRMLGYTEDELLTMQVPDVDVVFDKEKYQVLFDLLQQGKTNPVRTVNKRKDGSVFSSELTLTGYVIDNVPYMFAVLRDITERKKAEEMINASLKEKEALLQEIHHRVKNNLQVISSLLSLQSAHIKDRDALESFRESQNRIKSMALVHEKLYMTDDLSMINFIDYIESITRNLFNFYGVTQDRVALKVARDRAYLKIKTAIPCGLIVNELVSNSLKYAFPDNRKGEIGLILHAVSEDRFELTVSDNGIGLPEGLDMMGTKSLGLKLVEILSGQIHGNMQIERKNGTKFRIEFGEKTTYKGA
ncbi:MAG: histidine kinase dimerization/phosphoacceptor domain -containing protein, partial [Nitrospirota bacterium]